MAASQQTIDEPLAVNKAVVREFMDLAFAQRRPGDAAAQYLAAPAGSDATVLASPRAYAAAIVGWVDTMPRLSVEVLRILADGDLVAVQSRFVPAPGLRAMLVLDLFRVQDGRIVEHWDALERVHPPALRLPFG